MTTMYHGGETVTAHIGLCLTESWDVADDYAADRGGVVHEVVIDMSGLRIEETAPYDHDADYSLGDTHHEYTGDADILYFEDESPLQRMHDTYRLVSERALARLSW